PSLLFVVAVSTVLAAACAASPAEEDGPGASESAVRSARDASAAERDEACPAADEIAFAKEQGCANDGSVEFCIPKDDGAALASVLAAAPGVHCTNRGGGRANCDRDSARLCFYPTNARTCVQGTRAMTDATWAEVCAIAELPTVTR